jgi:Holliday junction resolvasome RuvABC DNA-binding subunit
LTIEGDARSGWLFRHADGSRYGGAATAPDEAEVAVNVFQGLRSLGFREGDCRKALEQVRGDMKTHVGTPMTTESMLRAALRALTRAPQRV